MAAAAAENPSKSSLLTLTYVSLYPEAIMSRPVLPPMRPKPPQPDYPVLDRLMTVRMRDDLYVELRMEAARRRTTMRAVIEAALEKELQS